MMMYRLFITTGMNNMWNVARLFEKSDLYLQRFTRKGYSESFREYRQEFRVFLEECDGHYQEHQDVELLCREVAGAICEYVADCEKKQTFKNRRDKDEWQQKQNTFVVAYIFPAILDCRNDYYEQLAKAIEERWVGTFKGNNIKAATFETLNGGFRKNIFGF